MENCEALILSHLPAGCSEIVSGGAAGVDAAARDAAKKLGLRFTCFLPDYERYGRSAPLERNKEIARYADGVLALWNFASRGTRHTLLQALARGKPVKIVDLQTGKVVESDGQEHRGGAPE